MDKSGDNDPKLRIYIEEIAKLFAKGLTPEQVAIRSHLEVSFVELLLSKPEFDATFQTLDPDAYAAWKDVQGEKVDERRLKARINEDAGSFYDIVAEAVKDKSSSLTDKERCEFALKLASLSDAAKKEDITEHVILSESHLANISATLEEISH